jgi:hypothetical protein
MLFEYIDAAGLREGPKDAPLFRTAYKKTGKLTENAMYVVDVCRMVKRRLKDAGLPGVLSPHSFRVTTITDLLEQGVALEDVQRLAGHADRRQKKITRKILERFLFSASHLVAKGPPHPPHVAHVSQLQRMVKLLACRAGPTLVSVDLGGAVDAHHNRWQHAALRSSL